MSDNKIVDIDWRVDVAVASATSLSKVAVPTAVVAITLGKQPAEGGDQEEEAAPCDRFVVRLTQQELHNWRYALAKGVRDLAYLEKKRPPPGAASRKVLTSFYS